MMLSTILPTSTKLSKSNLSRLQIIHPPLTNNSPSNNMHKSLVITGPSGSGKSTLIKHILKTHPNVSFSVSYTTRPPRCAEVDGRDYHFVSVETFQDLERSGRLLEHTVFGGEYYGTPVPVPGKAQVYDLDHIGVEVCKKKFPEFLYVYIDCDRRTLERRLAQRMVNGESNSEDMERRMRVYDHFVRLKEIDGYFDLVVDTSEPLEVSLRILEEFIKKNL